MREHIVHYIAPKFEVLPQLLEGLKAFELATRGAEPLARAAAIAFAFAYIHPMRDGNGRIHRFLINDTLIRDNMVPDGVILPVSATITSSIDFRTRYDRTLEVFSRPLMQRYAASYRFDRTRSLRGTGLCAYGPYRNGRRGPCAGYFPACSGTAQRGAGNAGSGCEPDHSFYQGERLAGIWQAEKSVSATGRRSPGRTCCGSRALSIRRTGLG